jgi:hypothetical protein
MAYEYLILTTQPNSLSTRYVQAYLKNTLVPGEVRLADEIIALNAPLSSIDLAAAWTRGTVVPNGLFLWNQLEIEDTDTVGKGAIDAILAIVRATPNPSLAAMTAAGLAVLDDHPKQLIAYNRVKSALDGATLQQVKDFICLLSVITYSKLVQRGQ